MFGQLKRMTGTNGQKKADFVPNVARIGFGLVNAYMLGSPDGPWVLLDTGTPGGAPMVRRSVARRFGRDARPEAIILTHGHPDHAGSALQLAEEWDVPIYAHPREMPFLTGTSEYPPPDPTIGGPMAFLARFMSHDGFDLGSRLRELPEDGDVPVLMADWRWIHTPGHTPGHVSLYRETDGVLIAGDALTTAQPDSWKDMVARSPRVGGPPAPFTPDWDAARESVEKLADLDPYAVAPGHGQPVVGDHVARELHSLVVRFQPPGEGRYVDTSPRFNEEEGVVELPPPPYDPLPRVAAGIAAGVVGGAALLTLLRKRTKK